MMISRPWRTSSGFWFIRLRQTINAVPGCRVISLYTLNFSGERAENHGMDKIKNGNRCFGIASWRRA
jgi:hypothetical protein